MRIQRAVYGPAANALEQSEKQPSETNQHTNAFLATLGHEMRNPLCALNYALQVWPSATDNPVQMEELRHIMQQEVQQLTRLADDLLDVARIAHGKLRLRREQVGLRHLIEGACEEVQPLIHDRGHALAVRMPDEPIVVCGDASRLLQVFANLIQNAAKFTAHNGRLCVTLEPQGGMAVVRVRDNGPGIEKHMLPAIFDMFTQVDGAHGPANGGLGIGLALVKTIVELHGGAVAVHSDGLGRGSEFTVQLPVMNEADKESKLRALEAGFDK